jgi:cell wall-associated NlpC family hydrolase
MEKTKIINLLFISSLSLFTACSTKEATPHKTSLANQPSVYNIMGITEPKKEIVHFVVKEEPHLKEAPQAPTIMVSPDVEFISYRESTPPESLVTNQLSSNALNNLEWNAKSFLGTPYVWGATGPSTFDCSGFTQWVYRDAGINIPRVSREQAKVGEYVRYENLQRGDMVFFDTKRRRSGRVTHVGIYLGNGNFIHASSAGKKVVIYNFNKKPFYKKRFLWGRRVTNGGIHYASN